jgi:S1-C subfamily serine protease
VTLQVLSDKDLKMGEKPSSGGEEENGTNEPSELGWAYQDQTPELQKELPPGAPKGPVITQVGQQSPAAAAGLRPGDVILKVGDTQIVSTNQLTAVLKKSDLKEGVRLFVWRNGVTVYALLQTGDE